MKKFLISLVIVLQTWCTMAQTTDSTATAKAQHAITLYGFARSEMYVNSRQNYDVKGGLICLYPKPIELDDYGVDVNDKVNAAFLAITSRIGLKYQYTQGQLSMGAHIEGDFCGTATYIDIIRLRHAYTFINYKNHSFTVGQTWHPYYDGVFPNVLTLNGGTPTGIINRSPQIRYDWHFAPHWKFTTAFVTEGIADMRPEAVLGISGANNGWKGGLMAEYRYRNINHTFTTEIGSTTRSFPLHAFTGTVYAQYSKDKWLASARVTGGQNLSHLMIVGGYGLVSEDSQNLQAQFANLDQVAAYVCASYGKKWRVNLFGGYIKTLGSDQACIAYYGTGANDVSDIIKAAASVEFNYKGLNVGLEAEYSNAAYGHWEGKKITPDYRVDNIRGVLRVTYSLSHTWNK
jgi:hypothetical protein